MIDIREDDVTGAEIVALIEAHLGNMHAITPPGSVHALGVEALRKPDITMWSAWEDGALVGCGALKALDAESGEIKAMRTADAHRRKGVAAAILEHILDVARARGYRRLFLETGAAAPFAPARALYERYGFTYRGPFTGYVEDANSVFMEKPLQI